MDADGWVKQTFDDKDVEVQNLMDGCNQFKGMKVCATAIMLPHGCAHPNSPKSSYEYDDHYLSVTTRGKQMT